MSDFYQLAADEQAQRLGQLARAALHHWGVGENARLQLLKYRENAVFSVTGADGDRFAMRVHRAGYHSDDELRSELQWMDALNRAGIKTPDVIAANDGALFKVVDETSVPEPRQVDLLAWVDGESLGSVEEGASADAEEVVKQYRTVGELMARLHNQAQGWQKPEGFSRHAWDIAGLLGEQPFWGRFWELEPLSPEQVALIQQARSAVRERLERFGQGEDRYGLIHCDFLPENLLRDGDGVRLIDFDDAGFGWHLFDIATSLFYLALTGDENSDAIQNAFIEGYRSRRELPDSHLAMLPTFFLLRGLVYLGWAHTRKETETAQELTPLLIEAVTALATDYLDNLTGES